MARQTSINCYHEHVLKFMNKQEARIYNALIELKKATRGEIAHHLEMEKSTVSASECYAQIRHFTGSWKEKR